VSPDMARAIAATLNVPSTRTLSDPRACADALEDHAWDIALIGAKPQRAELIIFTQAYAEIEAYYLVKENSLIKTNQKIDKTSVRIAIKARAVFTLWLELDIKHTSLHTYDSRDKARDAIVNGHAYILATLKSSIITYS
jgi:polar amino acid transport system substrate-binding protein